MPAVFYMAYKIGALLIERGDDPQWSYYVRNLHTEPAVLVMSTTAARRRAAA